MRIEALVPSFREEGVKVLVRASAQVPLRRLFDSPVTALESVRLDPASLGAPDPAPDAQSRLDLAPVRAKGMPAAHRGRPGIVVAPTVAQAMAFLLDRFEPEGDGQPDATIREVRERHRTRHARLRELEELLLRTDDDPMEMYVRGRRRRRRGHARFVWKTDDFERNFMPIKTSRGSAWLPALERGFPGEELPRPFVVLERAVNLGRFEVPQWDVLSPRQVGGAALVRGCIDGRWFQGPLSRVDARVLEAFEDRGRLVNLSEGDPLAGEALVPRFLVRVPRGAAPGSTRVGPVPLVAAALPAAYLLDSRSPVTLPPGLPVVDDPAQAWAVLLRTSSGVFLPDAPPAAAPRSFRALAGDFVTACVPAPLDRRREP